MTTTLTLEGRAALVGIIRRAARRGRELREANETADAGDPGREHSDGGGTPAPIGQNAHTKNCNPGANWPLTTNNQP